MTMRRTVAQFFYITLGLALPAVLVSPAANAADLYGEAPPYGYDERYSDQYERYGEGERRYEPRGYAQPRFEDRGTYGSTKDGDYLPPLERTPRFSEGPAPGYACAPRWQIRRRLQSDGWRNFEPLAVKRRIVLIRAESPDGRPFDLRLDRCSGEILAFRPSQPRRYGSYGAWPRRYGWGY